MSIFQKIDDIPGKVSALLTALQTALPDYHYNRGYKPFDDWEEAKLQDGVINILLDDEKNYSRARGMAAKEGALTLPLCCQLMVDEETATTADLQDAEMQMAEAIKGFVKSHGITAFDVQINQVRFSRQLEYPYGWIIATLELGPPGANTH